METVQGGVPPYGVKETLVVNGKNRLLLEGPLEGKVRRGRPSAEHISQNGRDNPGYYVW